MTLAWLWLKCRLFHFSNTYREQERILIAVLSTMILYLSLTTAACSHVYTSTRVKFMSATEKTATALFFSTVNIVETHFERISFIKIDKQ